MDNSHIYERIMMEGGISKIKYFRNVCNFNHAKAYGLSTIIDVGGESYRSYSYLMRNYENTIELMIMAVIEELLKQYSVQYTILNVKDRMERHYIINGKELFPDYTVQTKEKLSNVFLIENRNGSNQMFVIKDFGLQNRLPNSLIESVLTSNGLTRYYYVSLVEDEAYKEILNHNNIVDDPLRGTDTMSLKDFFNLFFDENEYAVFKHYAVEFSNRVKDYYGYEIVKTLKPNSIKNFRRSVREDYRKFDSLSLERAGKLSKDQRMLLDKNFYETGNCEIISGKSDFALSYMTSEWLYSSLLNAGNIDLSSIAMGYLKSIEQLLYQFISLHTDERDHRKRKIYLSKEKASFPLTDSLLADKEKTKGITLSSLVNFLGYHDRDNNTYTVRNQDLLSSGVNTITHHYILDVFFNLLDLRNGFFHRDNLLDWNIVNEVRSQTHLAMYLLLGAYKFNSNDLAEMGLQSSGVIKDDYYMLCDYMNKKAMLLDDQSLDDGSDSIVKPIYYVNDDIDPTHFYLVKPDVQMEYDEYGEPQYSGFYFGYINDKTAYHVAKDKTPNRIQEGELRISKSNPLDITPSGPLFVVFNDGKFNIDLMDE